MLISKCLSNAVRVIFKENVKCFGLTVRRVRRDIWHLSRIMKIEKFAYGVVFTNNMEMRAFNEKYRGQDKPTDILSFPFHEDIVPNRLDKYVEQDDLNLGDIYLGVPLIKDQSKIFKTNFHDLIVVLLTHGLCHLIGYTHDDVVRWEEMRSRETSILEEYNKRTGRNCTSVTVKPE